MARKFWSVINSRKFAQLVRKHETWLQSDKRKGQQLTLVRARLDFDQLQDSDLSQAIFDGVDFRALDELSHVKFREAQINTCWFDAVSFSSVDFTKAIGCTNSFIGSNFCDCVFDNSDLRSANFSDSYWNNTVCQAADFSFSNLCESSFNRTKILASNLCGANLSGVRFTNLKPADVKFCRLDFGRWPVLVTATHTQIGCQRHPNRNWLKWKYQDAEIRLMHVHASLWWKQYGPVVKAAILSMSARSRRRKTK